MKKDLLSLFGGLFMTRNWESHIRAVQLEPCAAAEDPLGFRAVYYLREASAVAENITSFAIGASLLRQRSINLLRAGYRVPMTQKALNLLEMRLKQAGTAALQPVHRESVE